MRSVLNTRTPLQCLLTISQHFPMTHPFPPLPFSSKSCHYQLPVFGIFVCKFTNYFRNPLEGEAASFIEYCHFELLDKPSSFNIFYKIDIDFLQPKVLPPSHRTTFAHQLGSQNSFETLQLKRNSKCTLWRLSRFCLFAWV